jgi:hypothetical protein
MRPPPGGASTFVFGTYEAGQDENNYRNGRVCALGFTALQTFGIMCIIIFSIILFTWQFAPAYLAGSCDRLWAETILSPTRPKT